MTIQKSLKERQAIIDRIKKKRPNDFFKDAILAGLNPTFHLAWTDLSGINSYGTDLYALNLEGVNLQNAKIYISNDEEDSPTSILRGAFLSGVELGRIDLSNADLSLADLSHAHLKHTWLLDANLEDANLEDADIEDAGLWRANLKNANLSHIKLFGRDGWCYLTGVDLTGVNLSHAELMYVQMDDACLINADMEGILCSYYVGLTGANLSDAYLVNANLQRAVLEYANLSRADLSNADLSENKHLEGVNLSKACLVDANLEGADLSNANLSGADLSDANLSGAWLIGADLRGANLERANLSNAYLNCANLRYTNLIGANLVGVTMIDADLRGAILDDINCEYPDFKEDSFTEPFQRKAEELSDRAQTLAPIIGEKWNAIALNTEPIDRQKAANSIKAVYALYGKPEPEIIFCDSPVAALKLIISKLKNQLLDFENQLGLLFSKFNEKIWKSLLLQIKKQLGKSKIEALENQCRNVLTYQLKDHLRSQLGQHIWELVVSQIGEEKWQELGEEFWRQIIAYLDNCIRREFWAGRCALLELYRTVCDLYSDSVQWEIIESLVSNCGWIFAFDRVCVVCDRPVKISFNNYKQLHALAEPAIEFADGYSLYYYHGVPIPKKYGSKHPRAWKPKWYLEEHNIILRRMLILEMPAEKLQPEWYLTEPDIELKRLLISVMSPEKLQPEWLEKETNAELRRLLKQRIGDE